MRDACDQQRNVFWGPLSTIMPCLINSAQRTPSIVGLLDDRVCIMVQKKEDSDTENPDENP